MVTDDERRDVARKLREFSHFVTISYGKWFELVERAIGTWGDDELLPDEFEYDAEYQDEYMSRLADLIDPQERTCRIFQAYGDESEELHHLMEEIACTPEDTVACICQSCGHEFRYERMVRPRYCPNCDARNVAEVD